MPNTPTEESDEDYYGPIANQYKEVSNQAAIASYGKGTEPPGGKGKKSRVIQTKTLRKIQLQFLANLEKDVMENSIYSWVYGSPLPSENSRMQPLGDYPEKL